MTDEAARASGEPPRADRLAGFEELVMGFARWLWRRGDVQFIAHCIPILALMVLVRPAFTASVPAADYESPNIFMAMVMRDINTLTLAAQRKHPQMPTLLFLVIPTVAILLSGARIRWEQWHCGTALRGFVMALLIMLCWSGATEDYNLYLNHGHGFDRLLLVGLTALAWRYPLVVPFAVKWALVMVKESYIPIPQDDFDFRSVPEVLIVFSCFMWLSVRKTFDSKHFVMMGLASWASYYFIAQMAKVGYGPEWSWHLENHLSNLGIGAHVRGWLGFLSHDTYMAINAVAHKSDRAMAVFTTVFQTGTLGCFFLYPRLTKLWLVLAFCFHFGIFALTGICFWKWMFCNIAFLVFLHRGGAPILKRMCEPKLAALFAMLTVYYAGNKIWFYPQTGVSWYDTPLVENYVMHAIGTSGTDYVLSPSSLTPSEMHWVQGYLCFIPPRERAVTGIYGTTGSYSVMKALNELEKPEDALKLLNRGRVCHNAARAKQAEDFLKRFFHNLNTRGRPWKFLDWIGRPTHLWVQPQGNLYDTQNPQEPVARIEFWREVVVAHGGKLHVLETKKVHVVEIP